MKILMVSPDLPAPPVSGGRVRTYHLLRELSRRHEIDVLAPELAEPEGLEATRQLCRRLFLYPPKKAGRLSNRCRQARSVMTGRLHPPEASVRKRLRQVLGAESYDVLHFVTPYLFASLPPGSPPPALVDFFGTSIGIQRELRTREGILSRSKIRLRYRLARRGERRVLRSAAGAVAISEGDRSFLRRLDPGARIEVVQNGVDAEYFAPQSVREEPHSLAFVGDMGFRPNVEGALFLVQEILPRLRAKNARIHCRLVGRNPTRQVLALGEREGVEIAGEVPDVRPHVARAAVVVVPLVGGSGVRNKTLEAMAMGRAVVSTSMGVEGLSIVPKTEVLVADEPGDFASAVLALLASPERRARMGEKARARVLADYAWTTSVERVERFYEELAGKARVPR